MQTNPNDNAPATTATEQQPLISNSCKSHGSEKGDENPMLAEMSSNSSMKGDDPKRIKRSPCKSSHSLPQLPTEILSLIINHLFNTAHRRGFQTRRPQTLHQCTLVSKQFHAIANPLVWQKLDILDAFGAKRFLAWLSDASQQRLQIVGRHIRELNFNRPYWTDAHLTCMIPHIPLLQHLTLEDTSGITEASFQHLPYHCRQLTSLDLFHTDLTQVSFAAIGQYCHQLCDLQWSTSREESPEWLALLLPCPLESLELTSRLNEKAIKIIKNFDRLTELELEEWVEDGTNLLQLANNNNTLTNDDGNIDAAATTVAWPRLESLVVTPCNDVDDTTLIDFIKSRPHLQQLHFCGASRLTDAALDAIAMWLPDLAYISLETNENVSAEGIKRLVRRCPGLMEFSVSGVRDGLVKSFDGLRCVDDFFLRDKLILQHSVMDKIRQDVHGSEGNNDNKELGSPST